MWRRLEIVETFEPPASVVVSWPHDRRVEVRRCSCGALLARKVAA